MDRTLSRVGRFSAATLMAIMLGAAAPQGMPVPIDDVGPLTQTAPAPARSLSVQNTAYQAAPVPDEDVQAPPGSVRTEAQLAPTVLSPSQLFQGDGYTGGSSQQATLGARKAGAAGLGLSVPVQQ